MPDYQIDASSVSQEIMRGHLKMGGTNPNGTRISVNSRYLEKDNHPWMPVMGEIHFSRYPSQYWEESLLKMKAGGITLVATYVFWIHHEEIQGEWDWTGQRSLREFVQLCAKHEIYLFLRIGPWSHGECRNGGFPDWLLETCSKVRQDDPQYLSFVELHYRQIFEQVQGLLFKDGGPLIGIQLENEYGHVGATGHPEHIQTLKELAVRIGFDVPLYSVTGWGGAWVPQDEVLPSQAAYASPVWTQHTNKLDPCEEYVFRGGISRTTNVGSDQAEDPSRGIRYDPQRYPYAMCEMGGGLPMFGLRRPRIVADDIAAMLVVKLGSGVNWPGYYMFHGGTNPKGKLTTLEESQETGSPNDLPVLSYDFQAPIREYGQLHDSYRRLKQFHLFLDDFGDILAPMVPVFPSELLGDPADSATLRYAVRTKNKCGFLFVNNYQRHVDMLTHDAVVLAVHLDYEQIVFPSFTIESGRYFIWPFNLDLSGVRLKFAQTQLLCCVSDEGKDIYVFSATPGVAPLFCLEAEKIQGVRGNCTIDRQDETLLISNIEAGFDSLLKIETTDGVSIGILIITDDQAQNIWRGTFKGKERLVISQSDILFCDGHLVLTDRSREQSINVFPPPDAPGVYNADVVSAVDNGCFAEYRVIQQESDRDLGVLVKMAESAARLEYWVTLPDISIDDWHDLFLRIEIICDKAEAYIGDELVADHFFNGDPWEIGLRRFSNLLASNRTLRLIVTPLVEETDIYLEVDPQVLEAGTRILSVRLVPEYKTVLK